MGVSRTVSLRDKELLNTLMGNNILDLLRVENFMVMGYILVKMENMLGIFEMENIMDWVSMNGMMGLHMKGNTRKVLDKD